ncbi:MAG: 2-amino-4-hydroxy-6-hydroxymethyldihydropteridine diphosphokinase [Ammonifex sp.]|nr:MAG: 2-amino-4-hydroxy-6-hydroxymethyldihydropteridine diphosphokinase [Ammonifex sp.]
MSIRVTAYIGLGSNLGDREENLRCAVRLLQDPGSIKMKRLAPLYRTAPLGEIDQPEFLNTVAEVATRLSPHQLAARLFQIEDELGRVRERHWGPRVVDLDLLLYDDLVLNEPDLVVPHPRLTERAFVVAPLAVLAPDMPLPGGFTASELAVALRKKQSIVQVKDVDWLG